MAAIFVTERKSPLRPLAGANVVIVPMAMNVNLGVLIMNIMNSIVRIPIKNYIGLLSLTIVKAMLEAQNSPVQQRN